MAWGVGMVYEGSFKSPFSSSRDARAAADPADLHPGGAGEDVLPQAG